MRVETNHCPVGAVVDPDGRDPRLPDQQFFQQPDAGSAADAFNNQGDVRRGFIPTDDVSGQTGLIVLGLEGAGRYALFIPGAVAIEAVQSGAGNNPVDSLAAVTTKMQLLAVDLIDNQVSRWYRQVAMDAACQVTT